MYEADEKDVARQLGSFLNKVGGRGTGTSVLSTVMGARDIIFGASSQEMPLKLIEDM